MVVLSVGGTLTDETIDEYAAVIESLECGGGIPAPSIASQGIFTGATIPLTYKNNTITYENNYEYKSATHNITIAGLDGRATITGNGTKEILVAFNVSSGTSSLKNFTITCVKGTETVVYNGMHAHYGTNIGTGVLTFAYTNVPKDGSEGTIGTEYIFIQTGSANTDSSLPTFSAATTRWNNIYSYQLLNTLIGKRTAPILPSNFLYNCYSFNQPLNISNATSIGTSFLNSCYSFNQPLDLSNITSIGDNFLYTCYSVSAVIWNASVYPTDNNSLSQPQNSKTSASGAGIKVYGTNRAGLIAALPNRTSSPYRKLVDGGS